MKRRGFLGLLGAAMVAPFVPPPTATLKPIAAPMFTVAEPAFRMGVIETQMREQMDALDAQIARAFLTAE